jgi:subtilisin family serine protease
MKNIERKILTFQESEITFPVSEATKGADAMPERGRVLETRAERRGGTMGGLRWLGPFLALLLALVAWAPGSPASDEARYIVVFHDSVDDPDALARAQTERSGGSLGFVYGAALKGYSARLPAGAAEALRRDPRVKAVRLDNKIVVPAAQTVPTGIKRTFAWGNSALQIDEKTNKLVNADVAVIDTGVDNMHVDVKVTERTYCNESGGKVTCANGTGTDSDGHGTHVAGTIAATDNTEGVVGIAPGARIWSVKVLDPTATESELVAGVNWVTERASEIEVANMSIGCESLPCSLPTMGEAISKSVAKGVVYVVAAGNNAGNAEKSTFGTNPDVITVSAIADYDGKLGAEASTLWSPSCTKEKVKEKENLYGVDDRNATFSNYGKDIEIAAPGVCIYSTVLAGFSHLSGTSMASPHVAGAAAIRASISNPNSKADVEAIRATLVNAGNFNWTDTSPDGEKEPLLDVSDEELFK